jgi:N-acetyl-anhydromuramyl-L-alanine amidase AmpD
MATTQYAVVKGDTLTKIVTRCYGGFDAKYLNMVMAANGIKNPDKIRVGQKLSIPGVPEKGKASVEPPITDVNHTDNKINALNGQSAPSETPTYKSNEKATQISIKDKSLEPKDYWKELYHKNLIMLHYTTGHSFQSAYDTFLGKGRVATPFVVETDGTIYRLYDERYWSYHIGIKGKDGENYFHDKRSIGIEIVNIGPVWYVNGKWVDYYKLAKLGGRTYSESEIDIAKNRDADGNAKFPDVQTAAVCNLVNWLLTKYDISRKIPADFTSFQLPALKRFEGIVTHQMYRRDKYDTGPTYPYKKLIGACGLEIVK